MPDEYWYQYPAVQSASSLITNDELRAELIARKDAHFSIVRELTNRAEAAEKRLAEVAAERDDLKYNLSIISDHVRPLIPEGQNPSQADSGFGVIGYMMSERAHRDRLRKALEMIAGERPCIDNLMGNVDIARAALGGSDHG